MNQRLQTFSKWLDQQEDQAAIITSTENTFYLTGFRTDPHERLVAVIAFPHSEPFMVSPAMEVHAIKETGWTYDIVGYSDTENPWHKIQKEFEKRNISVIKLAIEKEHLTVKRLESIQNIFGNITLDSAEEKLRMLRLVKDEKEKEILKQAAQYADFAIQVGINALEEGKTELDIIATIEYELKRKGISEMSFQTMVLTGKNAASPHGNPGLTKIKKGDLVLFDLGVVYQGYCSDITRTVAFGTLNDKQKEIYHTVLEAQQKAISLVKPGVKAKDIDLAARNHIAEKGYGEYFTHRLGHGLGVSVHEYPSITSENELVLQEGMVFTIEPGVYVPEVAGVRIEDEIYVTDSGAELLTAHPKEL